MIIHVAGAVGRGPTSLAAFDSALCRARIANFNLLRLSSVIPAGAELVHHDGPMTDVSLPGSWGDRMYVVMAEARTDAPGSEVWAGIGWVQDATSGAGLFVEHEATSEADLRDQITKSLRGLQENRHLDLGPVQMHVAGAVCESDPICAMVVAAYQVSDWSNRPYFAGDSSSRARC